MATNFGVSVSSPTSEFCRNKRPSCFTETVNGSLSPWSGFARVYGNSIGTPTVRRGAATMKMMSSTRLTATKGVTLISLIGAKTLRRRPRRPPLPKEAMLDPIPNTPSVHPLVKHPVSCPLVQLPRYDGGKLVGKIFQPQPDLRDI